MKLAPVVDIRLQMQVTLRPGRAEDTAACGTICYEGFKAIPEKHNFPPDFPSADAATGLMSMLLAHPDVRSTVAEVNGRIVGSNFLWKYMPVAA